MESSVMSFSLNSVLFWSTSWGPQQKWALPNAKELPLLVLSGCYSEKLKESYFLRLWITKAPFDRCWESFLVTAVRTKAALIRSNWLHIISCIQMTFFSTWPPSQQACCFKSYHAGGMLWPDLRINLVDELSFNFSRISFLLKTALMRLSLDKDNWSI